MSIFLLILAIAAYLLSPFRFSWNFIINDADGIVIETLLGRIKGRLACMDADEAGQPHGAASKEMLRKLCGSFIFYKITGTDTKWGRTLIKVYSNAGFVNLEMVKQGGAVGYFLHKENKATQKEFQDAEKNAKRKGRGRWKDKNVEIPAEFRKRKK